MNTISKLYWQLPWAGPRIDGDRSGWAVMPDPALGNAMGVCVPVVLEAGKVVLKLAQPGGVIPIWEARLGVWTTLPPHPGEGEVQHLCLLGYDQPEGGYGAEWVVTNGTTVGYPDLQRAVRELEHVRADQVIEQLLRWPAYDCTSNQPPGPAQREDDLSMAVAFGCCQYPSGLMDKTSAEESYRRLADRVDPPDSHGKTVPPTHLLLLGDQVYVDATAGLLDPIRLDDRYRVPYEGLLQIDPLRRVMRRVPVFCMLDDHEIADNWEPFRQGAAGSLHDRGLAAYWTYQRMKPPAVMGPMPPIWYSTGGPGWSAFMANTRTTRDWRTAARLDQADILGEVQAAALQDWLLKQVPRNHLKLIASPAMLLPRLAEHAQDPLHLDNWQGYPGSLHRLLAFLCDHEIPNVCFISGDAHIGCDVEFMVTGPGGKIFKARSIHAPALYAPLPFANENAWNLLLSDTFTFASGPDTYECTVEGRMLPKPQGCCLLEGRRVAGKWTVTADVL